MGALRKMWRAFLTPSPRNPDPHHRAATGVWHASLGAIPGLVLANYCTWEAFTTVTFVVTTYGYKEWSDLRRGGSLSDSIEDAAFVALGAVSAYFDAIYGLIAVNALALVVMYLQIRGGRP